MKPAEEDEDKPAKNSTVRMSSKVEFHVKVNLPRFCAVNSFVEIYHKNGVSLNSKNGIFTLTVRVVCPFL